MYKNKRKKKNFENHHIQKQDPKKKKAELQPKLSLKSKLKPEPKMESNLRDFLLIFHTRIESDSKLNKHSISTRN